MKKTIVLVTLAFLSISFVQAQDKKPTKEETIAFIKRTTEATVGKEIGWGAILEESSFSVDGYTTKQTISGTHGFTVETYRLLKWETMDSNRWSETAPQEGIEVIEIGVYFSSKVKHVRDFNLSDNNDKDEYTNELMVYIPKDKLESMKKAFLRLSEIAKEENKDPFEN